MKPNFKDININAVAKGDGKELEKNVMQDWETVEHINVHPVYTAKDLEDMEHLNYAAGIAPYLRGPYSTMYVMRPWTVRQYAGFSTAEESNAFYRRNIAAGQKTASSVMNSWMNSSGHRANILGSQYTSMGVGYAVSASGKPCWVQVFLAERG